MHVGELFCSSSRLCAALAAVFSADESQTVYLPANLHGNIFLKFCATNVDSIRR